MPTITKISLQKNKNKLNIFLDGKYSFSVSSENLLKNNLKINKELSEEDIKSLKNKDNKKYEYDRLLNYALLRPRSQKEIDDYMKQKSISKSLKKKLIKLDLINDEKFAHFWIEQRNLLTTKSIKEIYYELVKKGVSRQVIELALETMEPNEKETIKKIVAKSKWQRYDTKTKKRKIKEFLLRKGFKLQSINSVIDENEALEYNNED